MADVEQTIWDDPFAEAFVSSLHRRTGNDSNHGITQDLAKREDVDGKQESAPPELGPFHSYMVSSLTSAEMITI